MAEAGKKDAKDPKSDAQRDGASDAGAAAPAARSKRFLPYVVSGLLSIGLGVTAGVVTNPKKSETPHDAAPQPERMLTPYDKFGEEVEIPLVPLVTNLADPNQSVSGKFVIYLVVRTPKGELAAKDHDQIKAECAKDGKYSTRMRDALLTLFSSKLSTDLKTAHGKEIVKLEIIEVLKPILFPDPASGAITNVYFGDFVIQ